MPQHHWYFRILLIAFSLYAGALIYQTSFCIDGQRTFCLFDDAMVSMRYAKNAAAGDGLVWNAGGKAVEGFTNPLWVLGMVVFHRLPLDSTKISLGIQLCGSLFLFINLINLRRIADRLTNRSGIALFALALTAFYWPLNYWSLLGMEISLITAILSYALSLLIQNLQEEQFSPTPLKWLVLSTFVRMDMAFTVLALFLFLMVMDHKHRWKYGKYGLLGLVFALVIQTGCRYFYFHNILPNTYYLKMTGISILERMARGLWVLGKMVLYMNPLWFLLVIHYCLRSRKQSIFLLGWIVLTQIVYSVYVGGDAWEWLGNRYICIVMPFFFLLLALAYQQISCLQRYPKLMYFLGMVLFLNVNFLYNLSSLQYLFLLKMPADFMENARNVALADKIKSTTTPEATVAVTWAGAIPYFSERPAIDLFGKCDPTIAKMPIDKNSIMYRYNGFYPGHNKYNLNYSIEYLSPDVIVPKLLPEIAFRPFISDYIRFETAYGVLYYKQNSPHIIWDRIFDVLLKKNERD